jgi:hypothetical protein
VERIRAGGRAGVLCMHSAQLVDEGEQAVQFVAWLQERQAEFIELGGHPRGVVVRLVVAFCQVAGQPCREMGSLGNPRQASSSARRRSVSRRPR